MGPVQTVHVVLDDHRRLCSSRVKQSVPAHGLLGHVLDGRIQGLVDALFENFPVSEIPGLVVDHVQTDAVGREAAQVGASVGKVAQLVEVVPGGYGRQDLALFPAELLGAVARQLGFAVEGERPAAGGHRFVFAVLMLRGEEVVVHFAGKVLRALQSVSLSLV